MLFRNIITDCNNGIIVTSRIPYQSEDLPLQKIENIYRKISQKDPKTTDKIDKILFEEALEATKVASQFIRQTSLKKEKETTQIDDNIMEEEENIDKLLSQNDNNSSSSGTDVDEEEDL